MMNVNFFHGDCEMYTLMKHRLVVHYVFGEHNKCSNAVIIWRP